MIAAVIVVGRLMMLFAGEPIGDFVDRHPTIKMLALSFLLLIGVTLIAEGFDQHVPKGYIYFAMAFSRRRRDAEHPHAQEVDAVHRPALVPAIREAAPHEVTGTRRLSTALEQPESLIRLIRALRGRPLGTSCTDGGKGDLIAGGRRRSQGRTSVVGRGRGR